VNKGSNGNPSICGLAVLILTASLLLSACGGGRTPSTTEGTSEEAQENSSPSTTPSTTGTVPQAIFDTGEYGENIYEAARVNDWTTATNRLVSLKDAAARLPSNANSRDEEQLDATINALDGAVSAKDRQQAQIEANQVTLEAMNLSAPYKPQVPIGVSKLDYYGHELQIWSSANDEAKLKATTNEMRQTWETARPMVESRDPAEAQTFDELVGSIEASNTPSQYGDLAEPLLEEVDNLERLFDSAE
jgi:hypothetical protein